MDVTCVYSILPGRLMLPANTYITLENSWQLLWSWTRTGPGRQLLSRTKMVEIIKSYGPQRAVQSHLFKDQQQEQIKQQKQSWVCS